MMDTAHVPMYGMYRLMATVCLLASCSKKTVAAVASIGGQVASQPARFVDMLVTDYSSTMNHLTLRLVVLLQTIFSEG